MGTLKDFDSQFRSSGFKLIAGTDEAGRGPLAGPVVIAAVILPETYDNFEINDSKKLSENTRLRLAKEIKSVAVCHTIITLGVDIIEELNILKASLHGMKLAIESLTPTPHIVLVDGNKQFSSSILQKAIVKGDGTSLSIAAASILAKVERDRIMTEIHSAFPEYGWEKNKGYATASHRRAIVKYGASPHHRPTFLRKLYAEQQQLEIFK